MENIKNVIKRNKIIYFILRILYIGCKYSFKKIRSFFSQDRNQKYLNSQKFPHNHNPFFDLDAAHITYCLCGNSGDTYLSWCVRKILLCKSYDIIPVNEPVTPKNLKKINNKSLCIVGGGFFYLIPMKIQ